jgi:uncharacterized FlaG/YvyC family protein
MFEAVNSVISNASFIRQAAEQQSSARSVASQTSEVSSISETPKAPYISPYVTMDLNYDKAVLQIRDSDTGDVLKQFPSEETLASRQRQQVAEQRVERQERAVQQEINTKPAAERTSSASALIEVQGIKAQTSANAAPAPKAEISSPQFQAAISAINTAAQSGQGASSTVSTTA